MICRLFTCLVLLVAIHSTTSLDCYVCNSVHDTDCLTVGKLANFVQTCNVTVEPYCRRISQSVEGKSSTVRACGSKRGSASCYTSSGSNSASVCSCNTDRCNDGSRLYQKQTILTLVPSMVVLAMTVLLLR